MESLAVVASSDGGAITHYAVHLWRYLEAFCRPHFLSYADHVVDPFVRRHLPRVERLLDPGRTESIGDVVRFLREKRISLVNLHVSTLTIRHVSYSARLAAALRDSGIRIVATLHNVVPHAVFPVDRDQLRALYAEFHGFLVGNDSQLQTLYDQFDVGDRPVAVAPQGPYTLLNRGRFDRAGARRQLDLPATDRLVLFFGYLRPEKDLACLLRAMPLLRERIPDVQLLVHTSPRYLSVENHLIEELEGQARQPGIILRNDFVPSDGIEAIFRAADVLVLPYKKVTQSGALNVARAFALPVVVSEAVAEATGIDRSGGDTFPVDDSTRLSEALAKILGMLDEERRAHGALVWRGALREQTWEINAAALRRVLIRVAAGPYAELP